jgi:hypothetical protein
MATQQKNNVSMAIEMENCPATTTPPVFLANKLHDGDYALQILQTEFIEYTSEEERRLRRKIDFRLVPIMIVVNGIQFVDKLVSHLLFLNA